VMPRSVSGLKSSATGVPGGNGIIAAPATHKPQGHSAQPSENSAEVKLCKAVEQKFSANCALSLLRKFGEVSRRMRSKSWSMVGPLLLTFMM